jgi:hypothetical protein
MNRRAGSLDQKLSWKPRFNRPLRVGARINHARFGWDTPGNQRSPLYNLRGKNRRWSIELLWHIRP